MRSAPTALDVPALTGVHNPVWGLHVRMSCCAVTLTAEDLRTLICHSQLDKALQDYNRMREREAAVAREGADAAAAVACRTAARGSRRKSAQPVNV